MRKYAVFIFILSGLLFAACAPKDQSAQGNEAGEQEGDTIVVDLTGVIGVPKQSQN
ncbi:MAG: hypothetical protein UY85_C0024G0014 [Candidatus Peribacteria bacterium GW2011_GWB1_54_5]|nr:MAG: hypothetical protein UY87_C0085G0002 [Candidatus Peribacteria bacterium GW2011_GWC2_54_8]KKW38763.1 MAG: hypothetical protein UY85_C0024G0014 [Candidatus Peribacteria bacterium GW2011_GWB1_54_5]KKW42572.1 MAG: hypothetical protein UY90_C0037G0002 [Candidatus Peregrinibacteria bacterium GW2011_GWA2_54_9]